MIFKCKICGKTEDSSNWRRGIKSQLNKNQMCFACNHWRTQMRLDKERGKYGWAVVDGTHYVLAPHTDSHFKGMGGVQQAIKFDDGHIEMCDNVWCQGDIEHHYWKERMPDNAQFLNPKTLKPWNE